MSARGWQLKEAAPAGRVSGEPGRFVGLEGRALHGTLSARIDDEHELVVVANNGHALLAWTVPERPWRAASPLISYSSCALAQIPWVWSEGGRLRTTDPSDVAVGLVLAGRKPAALADTDDPRVARCWVEMARDAGLVAHATAEPLEGDHRTLWFVEVAVRGTLREHADLDALLADYRACLPSHAFPSVEQALVAAADDHLADLIADPDLIVAMTPGELARTGLVLGYHPATTAGLILGEPSISWATDEASRFVVNVLSHAADTTPLPGLPSAFADLADEPPRVPWRLV